MALLDRAIVNVLPAVPKGVVRRISSRYIAGTELNLAALLHVPAAATLSDPASAAGGRP